jgi:GntR family transcriptional regulator
VSVDPRSDRPIYRQVADILRDQITNGTLAPGAMLPSEKALADTYGIGRDAARQAIAVLRSEGLVRTDKGHGTAVRAEGGRRALELVSGESVIARMPTESERYSLNLDEGVPVLVVHSVDGAALYSAEEIYITVR